MAKCYKLAKVIEAKRTLKVTLAKWVKTQNNRK